MSITINGTTGIAGVDGSAGTPALHGNDTNTGIFFPAADTIAFAEGGVEVARFDSSGNLLIGNAIAGSISPALRIGNSGSGGGVVTATLSLGSYSTGYGSNIISSTDFNSSTASYLAFGTTAAGASGLSAPIERARIDSNGQMRTTNGAGVVALAYDCRAWVNFNGTGTVAIRASGNVSSITDNGTGDYTVNFTTAMPDANYCAVYAARIEGAVAITNEVNPSVPAKATGSIRVITLNSTFAATDAGQINVAIFR